jgi:hypothetical protein
VRFLGCGGRDFKVPCATISTSNLFAPNSPAVSPAPPTPPAAQPTAVTVETRTTPKMSIRA